VIFTAHREFLSQSLPEIKPILHEHWEELARNRDTIKLNPNFDKYLKLESIGAYRAYVVRSYNDEIAGYAGYLINDHIHYSGHTWALSDLFFVRTKFRRGRKFFCGRRITKGAGTVLFDAIEADLSSIGVSVMHTTFKLANPAAGKMLSKRGHSPIEMGYAKVLKRQG
jgi:hypothetical protein